MWNKQGKTDAFIALALIAIVVVGIWYFADGKTGSVASVSETDSGVTGTTQVTKVAVSPEDTGMTYNTIDKYYNNLVTTGTDQIKVKEKNAISFNAPVSAYATSDPYATIEYWKSNTSFFLKPQTITLNADSTKTITGYTQNNCTYSTTMTKLYNENGDATTNSLTGTINVTIGSGESLALKVEITSGDSCAIAPFGFISVNEYNNSAIDKMEFTCPEAKSASLPSFFTVSGTAFGTKTQLLDFNFENNNKLTCNLVLKAKSGVNPGQIGQDVAYIRLFARQYFVERTNGEFTLDIEDSDSVIRNPGQITHTFGIE